MSNWTLSESSERQAAGSIAGYAVNDALGVRLGHVSGWVSDKEHKVQMLKVTVAEWSGTSDYLVPAGAISIIVDTKSVVQLREVLKQTIGRLCFHYRGELPERRLLSSLQRHFPSPPVSVVERLARVDENAAPSRDELAWTRLSDMPSLPA